MIPDPKEGCILNVTCGFNTTCFKTPSLLCFTETNDLGGSIPFVALAICAEVSEGIKAIRVNFDTPFNNVFT